VRGQGRTLYSSPEEVSFKNSCWAFRRKKAALKNVLGVAP
jgi:hypothetical protein